MCQLQKVEFPNHQWRLCAAKSGGSLLCSNGLQMVFSPWLKVRLLLNWDGRGRQTENGICVSFGVLGVQQDVSRVTIAPSTFQWLMERCMGNLNQREVLVFVDNLIVFSKTLKEHEARLLLVLKRLREYGLKRSPTKCKFFQTSGLSEWSQDGSGQDRSPSRRQRAQIFSRICRILQEVHPRFLQDHKTL